MFSSFVFFSFLVLLWSETGILRFTTFKYSLHKFGETTGDSDFTYHVRLALTCAPT